MTQLLSPAARFRKVGIRLALGAGLLASLAGVYAFRSLSARPGEGALRLVPNDALVVATLDLSPSVSQTLAFKQIDSALARNGLDSLTQGSLLSMFERDAKGVDELSPMLLRSAAIAILPGPKGTTDDAKGVAFFAVRDGVEAQRVLDKNGVPQYWKGMKAYKLRNGHGVMLVVDDLLVAAENVQALYQVNQVRTGAAPAITANADFAGARTHVADDANLMAFVSPKALNEAAPKDISSPAADWLALGVAIRDGGLGISTSGLIDVKKEPEIAKFGQVAPVRSDLFKILPAGAYGMTVVSQPASMYEAVEPSVMKDKDARKGIAEMESSLQKETGISFRKDVLPAFKGDFILAAYPQKDEVAGIDLLAVADDTNGANPADAAARLQDYIRQQIEKEGNSQGPLWTSREASGARFFRISDKVESDMRKSFGDMDDQQVNKKALVGTKTIAWAVVGKAVIVSTNEDLLERTVATYQGAAGGLDTDAKFASSEKETLDGSQQVLLLSISRVAEGVRNTVRTAKMRADDRKTFEGIVGMLEGLNQPLALHAKLQSDGHVAAGAFIPLDYDKVIDLVGDQMKKK